MPHLPQNINIEYAAGRVIASTSDGVVGQGVSLEQALKAIVAHYRHLDEQAAQQHHRNLSVGNTVRIRAPRGQRIIDASGYPEGFPESVIDQVGVIESFDIHTMSILDVSVRIDNKIYRGSTQDLLNAENM